MATEVLLMQDVKDLGAEGEVVTVADGYARNYLFPKKLAAPVTEATRRRLAKMQAEREEGKAAALDGARALAGRLSSASCTITVKTSDDDKMYGSVTVSDIAAALKEQGIEVARDALALEQPIRELGVFDVPVKLHADVQTTVKVWVVEE